MTVTAARVRDLFDYDPTDGQLRWRVKKRWNGKVGAVAGAVNRDGYREIGVDGRTYKAHRLVWLHQHGAWPAGQIDHANRDRSDNRLSNLRDANASQNCANKSTTAADGMRGIYIKRKRRVRYGAHIKVAGKNRHLGYFDTLEQAQAAYSLAAQAAWGEFAGVAPELKGTGN